MDKRDFLDFLNKLAKFGWYQGPVYYDMKASKFDFLSYKRWALFELRDYIITNLDSRMNHKELTEKFRKILDHYACIAKNEDAKIMFSVAYDTVTDILDMIL